MNLGVEASLAVAVMQLKEVSLLTQAIRTADIQSGQQFGAAGIAMNPPYQTNGCDVYEPCPRIAPRVIYHPQLLILPRPVEHPTPRIEPQTPLPINSAPLPSHGHSSSPIQPPWKVLPWPQTDHSTRKIKAAFTQPDKKDVGALLNYFV